MHQVAILAMHGAVPSDLGIACDVFAHARRADGTDAYQVRVCGEAAEVRTAAFNIRAPWTLDHVVDAETVLIPGIADAVSPIPECITEVLLEAAKRGARIASICSGAFVLAATGLLDGRRVTTHWLAAPMLQKRYPAVIVDANVLFVDSGQFITSAGASAGLDMCLHLVRRDYGQAVAAYSARLAVAALEREGGQAQFIRHPEPECTSSLAHLLEWMQKNARRSLTLEQLAAKAATSPRTLSRRFKEQTGTTPLQWLLDARVRNAQSLLETTRLSVEEVADAVGFDGPSTFRARFRRTVGVSPNTYRRTFRGDASAG